MGKAAGARVPEAAVLVAAVRIGQKSFEKREKDTESSRKTAVWVCGVGG